MKFALILMCCFLAGCVQRPHNSLNGLWQDAAQDPFANCYASYHVDNARLTMIHFFQYDGKPFFEKGQGTFKDGVLKYHVDVLQTIDDWSTQGYHELTLSADGNALEGFYIDAKGNRGPLKFYRRLEP